MSFKRKDVSDLLAKCHRRCCICHRFSGVKMETDHIVPNGEGGTDEIENAIPVCFECHAEIHSYNPEHPRGRKYTEDELRQHKNQWLEICERTPESMIKSFLRSDVGPLQALVDELEFNVKITEEIGHTKKIGCPFQYGQFKRAIQQGSIAILQDDLKTSILDAYRLMGLANQYLFAAFNTDYKSPSRKQYISDFKTQIIRASPKIKKALEDLFEFLKSE